MGCIVLIVIVIINTGRGLREVTSIFLAVQPSSTRGFWRRAARSKTSLRHFSPHSETSKRSPQQQLTSARQPGTQFAFLHCVFTQTCWTFLQCAFSNVSSNCQTKQSPQQQQVSAGQWPPRQPVQALPHQVSCYQECSGCSVILPINELV